MGACCYPDGSCQYVLEAECSTGDWRMNVPCDPNPCSQPLGACCFPDGSCTYVTQADCQGDWLGMGTACDPNPCSQPMGACCLPDGSCTHVTQADCQGDWLGMGTVCDPNPCPPAVGACCNRLTQACKILTQEQCGETPYPSVYMGDLSLCDPNPCPAPPPPWGACLLPSGFCQILRTDVCQAQGGYFTGPQTLCIPRTRGLSEKNMAESTACCVATGECLLLSEKECVNRDGMYLGTGTACDPNGCIVQEGVEFGSWGKIKQRYR